jgi:DNA-binding NarL/FixJ family response regulator
MKITLNHHLSKHGYPVILDDNKQPMSISAGINAVLSKTGVSPAQFAACCNILPTTLRQYGRRAAAPANVLNMLGLLLDNPKTIRNYVPQSSLELSKTERKVLSMRAAGKSFREISAAIGVTRQRAYQIAEAAAGKRMKGGE